MSETYEVLIGVTAHNQPTAIAKATQKIQSLKKSIFEVWAVDSTKSAYTVAFEIETTETPDEILKMDGVEAVESVPIAPI